MYLIKESQKERNKEIIMLVYHGVPIIRIMSVESQKGIYTIYKSPLRIRRVLLLYKVCGNSALLFSMEHCCTALMPFWLSFESFKKFLY